ncbi:MAG: hypothetical protein K2X60_10790 [Xanthobacteraceae bacterium]|nr:hypothetical protein [Xanthobacteraceae bacterium]
MYTGIGLVAFSFIFGSGIAGLFLGKILPKDHHSDATQRTVQMAMSTVGILAALVLGLLIASAKGNLDTGNKEIEQFSTSLILLDREAVHFGAETKPIRDLLRAFTKEKIDQTWTEGTGTIADHSRTVQMLDEIQNRLRGFSAQSDADRFAQNAALSLVADLKNNSRVLAVQQGNRTSRPFFIVMIFWLSVLLLSYGVFAPPNATVIAAMAITAFSIAVAMNLIVDMDHPFAGYINVSKAPMQQALEQMKP